MFLGLGFCFILMLWENYAIYDIKDSVKKKDFNFVENLRKNLRYNNDDYTVKPGSDQQSTNTSNVLVHQNKVTSAHNNEAATTDVPKISNTLKEVTPIVRPHNDYRKNGKEDERDNMLEKIKRRVNDAFESKEWTNDQEEENNSAGKSPGIPDSRDGDNEDAVTILDVESTKSNLRYKTIKSIQKTTTKPRLSQNNVPTMKPQNLTSNNQINVMKNQQKMAKIQSEINDFKAFVNKNKVMWKGYKNSQPARPAQRKQPFANKKNHQPIRPKPKLAQRQANIIKNSEVKKLMEDALTGLNAGKASDLLPPAAMLDMAPARGGRIHLNRLKGRLCHRHVLLPEGPKYSSQGRAYLPAHNALRHPFNLTRAPTFLLPRCCNCCRKSALGCE